MRKFGSYIPNGVVCLLVIGGLFGAMASVMGTANMLNTIMHTAHGLLLNTCFYLMAMCVITGALGKIMLRFGVVDLLQKLLRPVMKPLYNMPGVASLGAVMTFLSDNPAIIALSQDKGFAKYFKKYQHVSLVNFGTAFGMGLIVIVYMMGHGFFAAPIIGLVCAMFGCVVSTRLMQHLTLKLHPEYREAEAVQEVQNVQAVQEGQVVQEEPLFVRIINAVLDGGKDGLNIGLAIIPGVLVISTFVMILTFGPDPVHGYTGGAYQGTQFLPWLAGKVDFLFYWLFGFQSPEMVSFPITALGAVGAALGLLPEFLHRGIVDGNAIAVFTAIGMCWSGYLSTDAATLDSLGYRDLIPRAFLSTFIGGICAGICAHLLYIIIF